MLSSDLVVKVQQNWTSDLFLLLIFWFLSKIFLLSASSQEDFWILSMKAPLCLVEYFAVGKWQEEVIRGGWLYESQKMKVLWHLSKLR